MPASHPWHADEEVELVEELYLPAPQAVHTFVLARLLYVPTSQTKHAVELVAALDPEYRPAPQPVHTDAPVERLLYLPAAQAVHTMDCVAVGTAA